MNNHDQDQWQHVCDLQPIIDPLIPPVPRVIGREKELAHLKHLLCTSGDETCVTIIGLPGMGKTTLAAALARDPEIREHFHDGILWSGLGAGLDGSERLTRWGALLGISTTEIGVLDSDARKWSVRSAIGERRMLLIIDDVWMLEDALAFQVGGPRCIHLVTTRFPALATRLMGNIPCVLNELNTEQSLDLLHLLAPQVVEQAEKANVLVQTLGGLPLALTLAGNYLRGKSYGGQTRRIQAALEELKSAKMRLQLSEPRSPINRHPSLPSEAHLSLHSVIALTDQSLSEDARTVLYTLSILPSKPDTFSKEAALAVSAGSANTLDALVDTGLLENSGDGRYTLHQTIADYARLHLQGIAPHERLIQYTHDVVEAHRTDYELLEQESETILVALDVAYELGKKEELVRNACVFLPFLLVRGNYSLAERHIQKAHKAAVELHDRRNIITTLWYRGQIAQKQGNYPQAEATFQEALALTRQSRDPERISAVLRDLGWVTWKRGNYAQAEVYLKEGLALARQIDDQERISDVLAILGAVLAGTGDYMRSETHLEEGLHLARQVGDRERICHLLMNLGATITERGRYEQAYVCFEEGLRIARQIGQYEWTSALLCNLGAVATLQGNYAQAETYQREGLSIARKIGHREWMSILLLNLGETAIAQEKYLHAEVYIQETVKLARQLSRPQLIARALYELGNLHLKQQQIEAAEAIFHEVTSTIPQGDLELQALAQYGLARAAAAQSHIDEAQQLGEISRTTLEKMGHYKAQEVRDWLNTLMAS